MTRTKVTPHHPTNIVSGLGITLALALLLLPISFGYSRAAQIFEDAGHAPLFAIVTWWFIRKAHPRHYAWICLAVIAIGGLTEVGQWFTGRDASWLDWCNDALGSLSVTSVYVRRQIRPRGVASALLRLVVAVAAVLYLLPPALATLAYARRHQQFPLLYSFHDRFDRYFIEDREAGSVIVHDGDCAGDALRVTLSDKQEAGVLLYEPRPDWRGYSTLYLELANPGPRALSLSLVLGDSQQNFWFRAPYEQLSMPPSSSVTRFALPLAAIDQPSRGRWIDLSRMKQIVLFRAEAGEPAVFCLRAVGLQ